MVENKTTPFIISRRRTLPAPGRDRPIIGGTRLKFPPGLQIETWLLSSCPLVDSPRFIQQRRPGGRLKIAFRGRPWYARWDRLPAPTDPRSHPGTVVPVTVYEGFAPSSVNVQPARLREDEHDRAYEVQPAPFVRIGSKMNHVEQNPTGEIGALLIKEELHTRASAEQLTSNHATVLRKLRNRTGYSQHE